MLEIVGVHYLDIYAYHNMLFIMATIFNSVAKMWSTLKLFFTTITASAIAKLMST